MRVGGGGRAGGSEGERGGEGEGGRERERERIGRMVGVQAIIAALYARDQQGAGGQHVTLAMLDTGIQFLWGEVCVVASASAECGVRVLP